MEPEPSTSKNSSPASSSLNISKSRLTRARKRKRVSSESSSDTDPVLPENLLEVEKNLHASAVKNNLDDVSVKKILKTVVTNDHVLALVKLQEEEENMESHSDTPKPKLTRSKAKELRKVSPKTAWNLENLELTPIKHIPVKTRPEVTALIAQELPEDEDDEEYDPRADDVASDDDHTLESCSDLDSQPRTPATPRRTASPRIVKDGPFKVPQEISTPRRKLDMDEEATIALRTRSKLSLSSVPIDHIEGSFVPPDELPMPAADDVWTEFLQICLNPETEAQDDDDDPEYNVAQDPDAHDEDEEGLENIMTISKKELNDLVTELFNVMPDEGLGDELGGKLVSETGKNNGTELNQSSTSCKQEPSSEEETPQTPALVHTIGKEKRLSIGKSEVLTDNECQESEKENTEKNKAPRPPPPTEVTISVVEHGLNAVPGAAGPPVPPAPLQNLLVSTQTVVVQVEQGVKHGLNAVPGAAGPTVPPAPLQSLLVSTQTVVVQVEQGVKVPTAATISVVEHGLNAVPGAAGPTVPPAPLQSLLVSTQTVVVQVEQGVKVPTAATISVVEHGLNAVPGAAGPPVPPAPLQSLLVSTQTVVVQVPTAVTISVVEHGLNAVPGAAGPPVPPAPLQNLLVSTQTVVVQVEQGVKVLPEQIAIYQQQLRQHVQLCASNFLQLFVHPVHWALAPTYKENLETFYKMVEDNPESVANVCNLKPAVDLVRSWETSVSADTPENMEMIAFVQKQIERSRRRAAQNNLYVGDFPKTFMNVVSNSPVFLYPHLLPPLPFRSDVFRKFGYLRCEDELLTLGMDQFWQYVEDNPDLFNIQPTNSVHRAGLIATLQLVCKHMFPWIKPKGLLAHIRHVRQFRKDNKDNPIIPTNSVHRAGLIATLQLVCKHMFPWIKPKGLLAHIRHVRQFRKDNKDNPIIPTNSVHRAGLIATLQLVCKHMFPWIKPKGLLAHIRHVRQFRKDNKDNPIIVNNPTLFNIQPTNSVHRAGLIATLQLVCKHMFPWIKPKGLLAHIRHVRQFRKDNKDNPIIKFFEKREVTPVKHTLLPFNPNLTLYEQPENEIPRIWVRHLSQSSKRFMDARYRRTTFLHHFGQAPAGVPVELGAAVAAPPKNPLPIDFTKQYHTNRPSDLPKPDQNKQDRFDIQVAPTQDQNTPCTTITPVTTTETEIQIFNYSVVNTPSGAFLIPVATNVTNSATTPICSSEVNETPQSKRVSVSIPMTPVNKNLVEEVPIGDHCLCCIKLRRISKLKQTLITDFLKIPKKRPGCPCKEKKSTKYPRATKKLRLLVNSYKAKYTLAWSALDGQVKMLKKSLSFKAQKPMVPVQYSLEEIAAVTSFQLKLTMRSNVARSVWVKKKIYTTIAQFNPDTDDIYTFMRNIEKILDTEGVDVYKEFLGFLTMEQADKIGNYVDYFNQECLTGLMKKVEEVVLCRKRKYEILQCVYNTLVVQRRNACDICSRILDTCDGYPSLAEYVFSLFPHTNPILDPKNQNKVAIREQNKSAPVQSSRIVINTTPNNTKNNTGKDSAVPEQSSRILRSKSKMAKNNGPQSTHVEKAVVSLLSDEEDSTVSQVTDNIQNSAPQTIDIKAQSTDNVEHRLEQRTDNMEVDNDKTTENVEESESQAMDYEADHSASDDDSRNDSLIINENPEELTEIQSSDIKTEEPVSENMIDTPNLTINKTEVRNYSDSEMSMMIMSEDEHTVKTEAPEWKRDEDKTLLEVLKQSLTPEEMKDKTILEIIEQKKVVQLASESLPEKSLDDVRERMLYLLEFLVLNEQMIS
ncbi:uncharacterized protein LOC134672239 [Cydia fagiglandana]|uniref:uncharacterized protein LOC134672239 n=1 Tax=Cydia fagiglandana TaxID=1458189 RepID=UPI002FEDF177